MKITFRCKHPLCWNHVTVEVPIPDGDDRWEGKVECPECGLDNYVEIEIRANVSACVPEER